MTSRPRIAIVGGGPAGLTMGNLLQKHRIPFSIFELRQQPTKEELADPSGMLDLHEGSGITAIRECGLYDDFVPLTGECTEEFLVADRNGKILFNAEGRGTRPEISRNNLSALLMKNIPAEKIKWGHKLISAIAKDASGNAEYELDFGAHGKFTFDLVVGADGAWSKVRGLLTDVKPQFTGMHNITLTIKNITKKYPHLAKLVGSGSFSALGMKHAVISQRGPVDSSRIYLWLSVSDRHFPSTSGLSGKPAKSAKDTLLGSDTLLGTFEASIKELVATACDEESVNNPSGVLDIREFYALPHGTSWEHKGGTTLVGDAAHLMLPNGEGVNMAMFDSLIVAQEISKAYETAGNDTHSFLTSLNPAIKAYETDLVDRAKEAGAQTDSLIQNMFGNDDAAYTMANAFKRMMEQVMEKEAEKYVTANPTLNS